MEELILVAKLWEDSDLEVGGMMKAFGEPSCVFLVEQLRYHQFPKNIICECLKSEKKKKSNLAFKSPFPRENLGNWNLLFKLGFLWLS